MATRVEVKNQAAVKRALRRAADDLDDFEDADQKVARAVADRASITAPRRTGRLRASITATATGGGAKVSSPLIYAPVIEYGWPARGIDAAGFIAGAVSSTRPRWRHIYQTEINRITRKAERTTAGNTP